MRKKRENVHDLVHVFPGLRKFKFYCAACVSVEHSYFVRSEKSDLEEPIMFARVVTHLYQHLDGLGVDCPAVGPGHLIRFVSEVQ